ncbi:DMT family transporter [Gordonia humi]|uniref:Drug/metabolite transporter (DMT)-like permease n=1 Tax=Gordonia humi TaxID=686429 RepID=A0A840EYM4_9ACTN|nr:DMT family transporter [Gordonia humi]MBB4134876.1 drug/metabolite transporter (DMT)-like permease [Gordonia humi]
MHTWVPTLIAIAAALLIAVGTVLRQRSSAANGAITAGWWFGAVVAIAGFGLQATALGLGSILLVQPLVVLAVLFVLPMEAWADHRRPKRSEWVWGAILVVCVVGFLLVARPVTTDRRPDMLLMGTTVGAVVIGLVLLVVFAEKCDRGHHKSLLYGLTSGALFGVSSLLIKAVAIRIVDEPLSLFVHFEVYLLVPVAILAVIAQQRAFGAGDLQTSFPAMNVMEPVVAMALGVALLGESISAGVRATGLLAVIAALSVISVAKLAKHAVIRENQVAVPADRQM